MRSDPDNGMCWCYPIGCSHPPPTCLHIPDLNQFLEQTTAIKFIRPKPDSITEVSSVFCWRALLELTRLMCGKITFWYNFGRGSFVCGRLKHSVSLLAVSAQCTNEKYKLVYKLCFNITTEEQLIFISSWDIISSSRLASRCHSNVTRPKKYSRVNYFILVHFELNRKQNAIAVNCCCQEYFIFILVNSTTW